MNDHGHTIPASGAFGEAPTSRPDRSDLIDAARTCIPNHAAPYDEVRISAGLLQWLISEVEG